MLLTQKLLGYINKVFSRDPQQFKALQVSILGAMTGTEWSVADGVLTLNNGSGDTSTIDLSQYTLGGLSNYIAGLRGFQVNYLDPDNQNLSALVLIDGVWPVTSPKGIALFAYQSLLIAHFEANSAELVDAEFAVSAATSQINIFNSDGTPGASGYFLDALGAQYGVLRNSGESDAQYGPRIIAQVLAARGNNVGMEIAISAYTAQQTTVQDVFLYGDIANVFNGAFNFDGSQIYDGGASDVSYCTFAVWYSWDFSDGSDPDIIYANIVALVEQLRAAGTVPISVALSFATSVDESRVYELITEDGSGLLILEGPSANTPSVS